MNPTSLNPSLHPALTFGQQGKNSTLKAGLLSLALLGAGGLGVANYQSYKPTPASCDQPTVSIDTDGTAITTLICDADRVELNGNTCKNMSITYPNFVQDNKGKTIQKDIFLCRTKPDTTILKGFRSLLEGKPQ